MHETLYTLNEYTLCEIFWLYERIVVRDMILEAKDRDDQLKEQMTAHHR
uniref:Uncharacterized protein n=1 Tax=Vibrio phage P018-4 TaxID=3229728 RepID=A0AB39AJ48_9CAUD